MKDVAATARQARRRFSFGFPALTDAQWFLLLAILIGMFTGLLVVCFHIAIEFLGWYSIGVLTARFRMFRLAAPALGGLVASMLVLKVFRAAQGSGVNQTKAALYISDGYVPASTVIGKFLACSISIGSGNSLGPEDPSLQMGAGVASLLGRMVGLKRDSMRMIAPVGAAAGIAAAFNTPITGVLFVMEEVVAAWNAAVVGSILLSAVSAVVVVRWFLGNEPLFRVPPFELVHPAELLVYAAVGVAGGILAASFIKTVGQLHRILEELPGWTRYVKPVAAGLAVGTMGLWLPQVMGAGYGAIDSALSDQFVWQMLLMLALGKMVATLLCFSANTPGGMFAPTLFTGAMIGGGMGGLVHHFFPNITSPASAYVLVGMGTFFAGVFRAPMTAIFMVFEVSASYVIILPVAIAGTMAYFVSRALHPVPFFTMLARQEGVDLPSAEERRRMPVSRIEDVMSPPVPALLPEVPLSRAVAALNEAQAQFGLVRENPGKWAIVSCHELEKLALEEVKARRPVGDAPALHDVPTVYPDLPVDAALRRLGSHPLLPVLSRADADKVVGTISLDDITRAFGIAFRAAPPDSLAGPE